MVKERSNFCNSSTETEKKLGNFGLVIFVQKTPTHGTVDVFSLAKGIVFTEVLF